jgi:predicted DNA-binding transcriptional regulator YafY
MRATRLLSIILLLQARGRLTAQQLADELQVSVRTIYRDVDALQLSGVPIYGEQGRFGGYQLVAGYSTRLTGLTTDEADALFLGGIPGPAAELGLGAAVAAAQLKLQAALPPELRHRARRILDRFHLDAPTWYQTGDRPRQLAVIADAVWQELRIKVVYQRWEAPTEVRRTVDPHGLVLKAGIWYLVARCGEQFRTYRVSQITKASVLGQHFARHDDFDLARYWGSYLTEFDARLYTTRATIRLSPECRRGLRRLSSAAVSAAVDSTASEPDSVGWVTAVVPIESIDHAQAELLRFGAGLEVLEPPELRHRLRIASHELSLLYG